MPPKLILEPACSSWAELIAHRPTGALLGYSLEEWRTETRRSLGLETDRPLIATGHQTLLWHPGILVKYMVVEAMAGSLGWATANLVVDQHAGDFGDFLIPVRRRDGSLSTRRIVLTDAPADIPMALHPSFIAAEPRGIRPAIDSVGQGVERVVAAVNRHTDQPNAALQMAHALADLMQPRIRRMTNVTASALVETALSRALMQHMADDPQRCAEAYNDAVRSVPEAGVGPLMIRDDYVELPLWRIRDDGRRMHAYDNDVQRFLESPCEGPPLLPRALYMTALLRLGMCDLFVHGTGGGVYDRAMEVWIRNWLGVETAGKVVASATVHLPLLDDVDPESDPRELAREADRRAVDAHRVWHNPEPANDQEGRGEATTSTGPVKAELLRHIDALPTNSLERRRAFYAMHEQLETMRGTHAGRVEMAQRKASEARTRLADLEIARRRDWAFPLYPEAELDDLWEAVRGCVQVARPAKPLRSTRNGS